MITDLLNKYRPKTWEDVYGNGEAVRALQSAIEKKAGRAYLLAGPSGVGKEQPITCQVITPTGWRQLGKLCIGDEVYTADGTPTVVRGIYEQGVKTAYRVSFSDGSSTMCGIEHLWAVTTKKYWRRTSEYKVLSLKQILDVGGNLSRWRIPTTEPVQLLEQELPIHPYILGALIGDGYLRGNSIALSNPDIDRDIRDRVAKLLPDGVKLKDNRPPSDACPQLGLVGKPGNRYNPIRRAIIALGLNVYSKERFIPECYKLGSVDQRLSLLHGLMDTDGSAWCNRVGYSTSSPVLAKDIVELVQSLGGLAWIRGNEELVVTIKLPVCPFLSERKKQGWWPVGITAPKMHRSIVSIEELDQVHQVCISVDNPSGLYLTDHFIVTHNTTLARIAARALGGEDVEVVDIDAASNTGIEAMREVCSTLQYRPLGSSAKAVIVDECFVSGTLVDTPTGPIPIEELRAGDQVLGAKGVQTVKHVMKRMVPLSRLITVEVGGSRILCSKEHPFLTDSGWYPAENLDGKKTQDPEEASKNPLLSMWDANFEQQCMGKMPGMCYQNLRDLWGTLCIQIQQNLLQSLLYEVPFFGTQSCLATSLSGSFDRSASSTWSRYEESLGREARELGQRQTIDIRAYEGQQPFTPTKDHSKDYRNSTQERYPLVFPSRWQWPRTYKTPSLATFFSWGATRTINPYPREERVWLAHYLQSRYWFSRSQSSYRSGRDISPKSESQGERPKERFLPGIARVGSLTSEEQRCLIKSGRSSHSGEDLVVCYDLEICEHPSFSVARCVVHNCHALSKAAVTSLLKPLEEPPPWVYWFLCTTEPVKIPTAVQTRCIPIHLKSLSNKQLFALLTDILQKENKELPEDIVWLCAEEAYGSARQAIGNLVLCWESVGEDAAAGLLRTATQSPEAFELAQALYSGKSWKNVVGILEGLNKDNTNPESIRQIVRAYGVKKALGSSSFPESTLAVLDAFSVPFNSQDGIAPVVLACGKLMDGGR